MLPPPKPGRTIESVDDDVVDSGLEGSSSYEKPKKLPVPCARVQNDGEWFQIDRVLDTISVVGSNERVQSLVQWKPSWAKQKRNSSAVHDFCSRATVKGCVVKEELAETGMAERDRLLELARKETDEMDYQKTVEDQRRRFKLALTQTLAIIRSTAEVDRAEILRRISEAITQERLEEKEHDFSTYRVAHVDTGSEVLDGNFRFLGKQANLDRELGDLMRQINDLKASLDFEKSQQMDSKRRRRPRALSCIDSKINVLTTEEERRTRASRAGIQRYRNVKNSTVKVDVDSDVDETVMGESRAPAKEPKREQEQKIVADLSPILGLTKSTERPASGYILQRSRRQSVQSLEPLWKDAVLTKKESDVEDPPANTTCTSGLQLRFLPNLGSFYRNPTRLT